MSVVLHHGDCIEVMRDMAEASVDSCVCDPPYHLTSIVKRFGSETAAPAKGGVYSRSSAGFMGKQWDGGDVAFRPETWAEVLRVLKPGGHLIAFSGTRTYHRMVCAIEDAWFEIRDQIGWLYGSGFPKSHNLPGGLGTALKPAWEPICLARKPLIGTVAANVAAHGTGALNIDGCRVGFADDADRQSAFPGGRTTSHGAGALAGPGAAQDAKRSEFQAERHPSGRWPANVAHDGSDEVLEAFAAFPGGRREGWFSGEANRGIGFGGRASEANGSKPSRSTGDTGTAARFFFSAKASKAERGGSKHPTIKPVSLMRWLCRLVTPPGGTILDCFAGSGTTGIAAAHEGFNAVLIEREAEYIADIKRRLSADAPLFAEVA